MSIPLKEISYSLGMTLNQLSEAIKCLNIFNFSMSSFVCKLPLCFDDNLFFFFFDFNTLPFCIYFINFDINEKINEKFLKQVDRFK